MRQREPRFLNMVAKLQHILQCFDVAKASMCLVLNRSSNTISVQRFFGVISRLVYFPGLTWLVVPFAWLRCQGQFWDCTIPAM